MSSSGEPEFVFAHRRAELRQELADFWAMHQPRYREEMRGFQTNADTAAGAARQADAQQPLRRQVAAISRDHQGAITGVVWVALRELEPDWNLGTHAYFQRMYVVPSARSLRSSLRLYATFLQGFQANAGMRDHRARVLLAENMNPGLQLAALRRLFARHGFQLLGSNHLGGGGLVPTAGYNFCILGIGSNHDLLAECFIEPGIQLTPANLSLHVVLLLQGCAEVVDSGVIAESLPNRGRCFIQREVVTGGSLKQA